MTRAIATALLAATLASGCDRIVNLTPAYDALPTLDGHPDGGFALDAGLRDGSGAPGDGAPDDGPIAPSDGNGDAFPDGNPAPDDAAPRDQ